MQEVLSFKGIPVCPRHEQILWVLLLSPKIRTSRQTQGITKEDTANYFPTTGLESRPLLRSTKIGWFSSSAWHLSSLKSCTCAAPRKYCSWWCQWWAVDLLRFWNDGQVKCVPTCIEFLIWCVCIIRIPVYNRWYSFLNFFTCICKWWSSAFLLWHAVTPI